MWYRLSVIHEQNETGHLGPSSYPYFVAEGNMSKVEGPGDEDVSSRDVVDVSIEDCIYDGET